MANFPNSVYSPAAKSAGQTIQASFFNDPDGEISAIEDGYLNGTARLNSSGSTVASLTVTSGNVKMGSIPYAFPSSGGSTGDVLTCVSTSGSTMGVEWRTPSAAVPQAARVQMDDPLQYATGSTQSVTWTRQIFLTNSSMHSTGTNPDRLTPQSTGIYLITAEIPSRVAGSRIDVYLKDSSGGGIAFGRSSNAALTVTHVSGMKRFDALGGYARVAVESGGSTNSISTTAFPIAFFEMVKL